MTLDMKRLGRHLQVLREARGLSQEDLAAKIPISRGYLARLETGRHEPSLSMLEKLATIFKVPMMVLLKSATRPRKEARMVTALEKIELVGNYLKESFPGHRVYDAEDFDRDCQYYRIDHGSKVRHRVRVGRELLDDHTEEEILRKLRQWQTPDVIRLAGTRPVLIVTEGCSIEGPPAG